MRVDEARRGAKPCTAHHDVIGLGLQSRADLSCRPDREQPVALDHDRGIADHAIRGVDRQREVEPLKERAPAACRLRGSAGCAHGTAMDSPRFRNRP